MHVWYCSNKDDGIVTDYVAYRKGTLHDDGRWTFGDKQLVLEHGKKEQWDSRHVCDPTVVKGVFKSGTDTYNYMMAFLGCSTSNNTKNEVGVAFAKNPEGPWVKYAGNPVADFYADYSLSRTDSSANSEIAANNSWGYGQPSLISADKNGKVILFYSCGVPTGTFTVAELWDFTDIASPVRTHKLMVSNKGITNASGGQDVINNADFAYDAQKNRLYCIKEDFPYPTGNNINWIAGTNTVFYVDLGASSNVADRIFENYTGEVATWYSASPPIFESDCRISPQTIFEVVYQGRLCAREGNGDFEGKIPFVPFFEFERREAIRCSKKLPNLKGYEQMKEKLLSLPGGEQYSLHGACQDNWIYALSFGKETVQVIDTSEWMGRSYELIAVLYTHKPTGFQFTNYCIRPAGIISSSSRHDLLLYDWAEHQAGADSY